MAEVEFGAPLPPGRAGERLLTIPPGRYTSPEFLAAEREHLWPSVWLLAGFACDVAEPGDCFVFEHGDDSILVSRDASGSIAAFHNVCLHRGHLLRDPGRGRCTSFRCPYHNWNWGLDGTLLEAPIGGGFPLGIPENRRKLAEVTCRVWAGLVWIHMGAPRETLQEYLGPVHQQIGRYGLEQFAINDDLTLVWETNWKTALDGFNETYHVRSTHPQYSQFLDATKATLQFDQRHSRLVIRIGERPPSPDAHEIRDPLAGLVRAAGQDPAAYDGKVDEARAVAWRHIRRTGKGLDRLSDEQLIDSHQFYVFPNVEIDFHGANDATVHRFRPHPTDPNRCFFDVVHLARKGSPNEKPRPGHQVVRPGDQGAGIVYDQDMERLFRVQRGMRVRGFPGALPSRLEGRIPHMHQLLDEYVGEHIPAALRVS